MSTIESNPQPQTTMRQFWTIWGGQAVSLLGSSLVQFALIWYLTEQTGSATMLALASLVGILPQVILGPIAGALVDRWNRRRVMLFADSFIALVTVGLAVDFWLGTIQPWHILILLFLRSVGGGFHWPAMTASTSLIVPDDQLARIAGLNQALQGGMNIIAAPLGALLLTFMTVGNILMIDVVSALFAIVPLLFIMIPQPERTPESLNFTLFDDLKAGFAYVWEWKGLFYLMMMATALNFLLVPTFSLLAILVSDAFEGGAGQFALMQALFSIGTIVGGVGLGIWGGFKKRIWTSWAGLIVMAGSILAIGFVPADLFPAAVVAVFFTGIGIAVANGPLHAILQSVVDKDKQGRVFTLVGSLASLAAPVGLIIAGPLADAVGVQSIYVISGVGAVLLAVALLGLSEVRNIEDHHQPASNEITADEEPSEELAGSPVTI